MEYRNLGLTARALLHFSTTQRPEWQRGVFTPPCVASEDIRAPISALADAAVKLSTIVLWGLWAHHGRWSCRELTWPRSDRNVHHPVARSQEVLRWDILPLLSDFRPRRLAIPTPQARPKYCRKMTTFTRIPEGENPSIIVDVSRRLSKIGTSRMA